MRRLLALALAAALGLAIGRAHAEDEPPPGPTCSGGCNPPCKPDEWCRFGSDSTCACEAVE